MKVNNNSLGALAFRQAKQLTEKATVLGGEAARKKQDIGSLAPQQILADSILNNQLSTYTGCASASQNAISYLQNAQAALQEQQNILQAGLDLATQAATDPSMQSASTLATLDAQYTQVLNASNNVTQTTRDAVGNLVLTGLIMSAGSAAQGNIATIAGDVNTTHAANASLANIALKAALAAVNLDAATLARLDTIASGSIVTYSNTFAGTIDYLSKAFGAISSIGIDTSQIQQQVNDAVRASQIGASLAAAIQAAKGVAGAPAGNTLSRIAAHLVNEAFPLLPAAGGAAAPVGVAAGNAAKIRALLTESEIQAIKDYASATPAAVAAADVTPAELIPMLQKISCLVNVSGLLPNPLAAPTDLFGALAAGNVDPAAVFGNGAKDTISKYLTTALTNLITNAKPQTVQVGLNSTDTVRLQINNSTNTALGLADTTLLNVAGASSSVNKLKTALNLVSSNLANINNQITQLSNRSDSLNTQIDSLNEQIAAIEDTDLVANASQLSEINTSIGVVGSLINVSDTLKRTIADSASRILNRS